MAVKNINKRLYQIWCDMKYRCNNPKSPRYRYYGGKGVTVCGRWMEYEGFKLWAEDSGYKDSLVLQRHDVDGNYDPNNCYWTEKNKQNQNQSTTHHIKVDGESVSVSEAARRVGLCRSTLSNRLNAYGYNDIDAVTKEVRA